MTYRAKVYFSAVLDAEKAVALASQAFDTEAQADALPRELLATAGVTGGHLEAKVPGVGWVPADEAESVAGRHHEPGHLGLTLATHPATGGYARVTRSLKWRSCCVVGWGTGT